MQATIYDLQGQAQGTVELNDAIYGIAPNSGVVHQAVLRQQANARLGTHDTRTRAEVRGGGRKPWRQKGTGRARQGSTRAPQWRHGGVVFGPHPRSYNQDLPRKMRRLAMRSVLSAKAADGRILLVDSFDALEPRTKAMIALLDTLRLTGRKILIMTPGRVENLDLAAGNLSNVSRMHTGFLSLVDMLKAEVLVMDRASVDVIESILGQTGGRNSRPIAPPEGAPATLVSPLEGQEPVAPAETAEAPAGLEGPLNASPAAAGVAIADVVPAATETTPPSPASGTATVVAEVTPVPDEAAAPDDEEEGS